MISEFVSLNSPAFVEKLQEVKIKLGRIPLTAF
jgi:hypothetical protein